MSLNFETHGIPAFVTFDAMRCQRAASGLALVARAVFARLGTKFTATVSKFNDRAWAVLRSTLLFGFS